MKETLFEMRQEYSNTPLHVNNLAPDPIVQFGRWFQGAKGLIEPNAMTLATVDASLQPSLRTVLLKLYDADGFVFFSNYGSKKADDLAQNPKAAVHFAWLAQERQVEIQGIIEKISRAESLKYFLTRPRGSQIGAWVSSQSSVIDSRALLEEKFRQLKHAFLTKDVPLPDFWGGYRLRPHTIEFWQGGQDRLHDRFEYTLKSGQWTLSRLAP